MKMRFTLLIALTLMACGAPSQEEQEKAMIAQAQKDAEQEQSFRADSLKLASTFTQDTIAQKYPMSVPDSYEDDNGDTRDTTYTLYVVQGKQRKFCNGLAKVIYDKKAVGDTLTCQWSDKVEQPADE